MLQSSGSLFDIYLKFPKLYDTDIVIKHIRV